MGDPGPRDPLEMETSSDRFFESVARVWAPIVASTTNNSVMTMKDDNDDYDVSLGVACPLMSAIRHHDRFHQAVSSSYVDEGGREMTFDAATSRTSSSSSLSSSSRVPGHSLHNNNNNNNNRSSSLVSPAHFGREFGENTSSNCDIKAQGTDVNRMDASSSLVDASEDPSTSPDADSTLEMSSNVVTPRHPPRANSNQNDDDVGGGGSKRSDPHDKNNGSASLTLPPPSSPAPAPPAPCKRPRKQQLKHKAFECSLCELTFLYSSQLLAHMQTHLNNTRHECKVCLKVFTLGTDLKKHRQMCHNSDKPYACPTCGKGFKQRITMEEHVRIHTGEKPFVCANCGKSFSQRSTLKDHMRRHSGERPFECTVCRMLFGRSSTLKKHMQIHTGSKPHVCPHCQRGFARYSNLQEHIRTHTGEKPHECPTCERRFAHRSTLQEHKKTHKGSGQRTFTCPKCQKAFTSRCILDEHLKAAHAEKIPLKCPQCANSKYYNYSNSSLSEPSSDNLQTGDRNSIGGGCGNSNNSSSSSRSDGNSVSTSTVKEEDRTFVDDDKHPFQCIMCGKSFSFEPEAKSEHLLGQETCLNLNLSSTVYCSGAVTL